MGKEHRQKEKNPYVMQMENPRSRLTDLSPTGLAKEVSLSTNTVKSRLRAIEVNFGLSKYGEKMRKDPSADQPEKFEPGEYQMFNYECLPILKAYLNMGSETIHRSYQIPVFLEKLKDQLEGNPDQSFCRDFLYSQPEVQKHLLGSRVRALIDERLHCIKILSEQLVITPSLQVYAPGTLSDILVRLDGVILGLANYANLDDLFQKAEHQDEPKDHRRENAPGALVKRWCADLQQKRNQVTTDHGDISISLEDGQSIASGLNNLLHNAALSNGERNSAQKLHVELIGIQKDQELRSQSEAKSRSEICEMLQAEMERYGNDSVKAVFEGGEVPKFERPVNCSLPPVMISMIWDWTKEAVAITEPLQTILYMTYVWLKNVRGIEPAYAAELRSEAIYHIKTFWDVMRTEKYVPESETVESAYASAIDQSQLSAQHVKTKKIRDQIMDFFMGIAQLDAQAYVVVGACAVTLEYFWKKHAMKYALHFSNLYGEYQEALKKIKELP